MKLKEVCKQTGLTQKTVRFYEEKQLISPTSVIKNGRSYREYSDEDVKVLREIAVLRKALFSLEEIYLMQQDSDEISQIVTAHKQRVAHLTKELAVLSESLNRLEDSDLTDISALAGAMDAASTLPLPVSDISPHFRYIDDLEHKELEHQKLLEENKPKNSTVFVDKQNFYERKGLLSEHFPYDPALNGGSANFHHVPDDPRPLRIISTILTWCIVLCTLTIIFLAMTRRVTVAALWHQIRFCLLCLDVMLITVRLLTKRIYTVFANAKHTGTLHYASLLKYTGIILAVIVLLAAVYFLSNTNLSLEPSPDITVVIGTQQNIDNDFEADVEYMFGRNIHFLGTENDLNGDGEYKARVLILNLKRPDQQQELKNALSYGDCSLLLLDPWCYKYLCSDIVPFSEMELTELPEALQNTDDPCCYDISSAPFISDMGIEASHIFACVPDNHNQKLTEMTFALLDKIKDAKIQYWY